MVQNRKRPPPFCSIKDKVRFVNGDVCDRKKLEYGAFPDRPYNSSCVYGDATKKTTNSSKTMINLQGKRILFFSPCAFGYELAIKSRMEELGASVVHYDDRPSNGFWGKAMLRVNKHSMKFRIEKYYNKIWKELEKEKNFDNVFLLNLEAMPLWFLTKLREKYINAIFILYTWDSFRNKVHTKDYMPLCHRCISFDPEDQKQHKGLEFRPLFYLNEYASLSAEKNYQYDISFVGTAHSDRCRIANSIKEKIENSGGVAFNYFYLQSKKLYFYLWLTNSTFRSTQMSDFKYVSLKKDDLLEVIKNSKIVLDIQHPMQTGLTMRTIEMIGAERKLITTNTAIKDYDFYNPNNIYIIDRDNPSIDPSFFSSPYQPVAPSLYHKYSLDGWLEYIFR